MFIHVLVLISLPFLASCGGPRVPPASPTENSTSAPSEWTTVADKDADYILDEDDKCPDEPEDIDGFEDTDGCPDYDVSPY